MLCKVIYEDREVLVIYKPAGLATQGSSVAQKDVVSELKGYLQKQGGREAYLGVVHRLDQPVEGLLAFAKTPAAAAALTKQLGGGSLHKKYSAVVLGKPVEAGRLVDFLRKDKNMAIIVDGNEKDYPDAKEAKLRFRVKETKRLEVLSGENADARQISLLEVEIETGRFHQIRVQLAHSGFPILGDQKYGSADSMTISRELGVRNVALCAGELEIRLPKSNQMTCFQVVPENTIFHEFSLQDGAAKQTEGIKR